MVYTVSFECDVGDLLSNLMSWQRKVVIVRESAYLVPAG